jgi:hypothetical protein
MDYLVADIDTKSIGDAVVDYYINHYLEEASHGSEYDGYENRGNPDHWDYDEDYVPLMINELSRHEEAKLPKPFNAKPKEIMQFYDAVLESNPSLIDIESRILNVVKQRFHEILKVSRDVTEEIDDISGDPEMRDFFLPSIIEELNKRHPLPNPNSKSMPTKTVYELKGGDLEHMGRQMDVFLDKFLSLSSKGLKLDPEYIHSAVEVSWAEVGMRHDVLSQHQIDWLSSIVKRTMENPETKERAKSSLIDAASSVCLKGGVQMYPPFNDVKLLAFEKNLISLIKRDGESMEPAQAQVLVDTIGARYPDKDLSPLIKSLTQIVDSELVADAFELYWPNVDAMLSSRYGDVTKYMASQKQSEVMLEIGTDVYTYYSHDSKDCEGHSVRESWNKNEQLHRYGGPAYDYTTNNYIAAEAHMDSAGETYAINGQKFEVNDLTYERITRAKMPKDISEKIDNGKDLSHEDEVRLGKMQMM